MMRKNVAYMAMSMFVLLFMLTLSSLQAKAETLYPDYIEDEVFAQEIVNNTNIEMNSDGFSSIDQELTQEEFEDIAKEYSKITITDESDGSIKSLSGIQYFVNVGTLTINNLDESITAIPEEINTMTTLDSVDLSNNNFNVISNIDKLKNLEILQLNNNNISKIEGLPSSVNNLYLNDNDITKIENLEDLEELSKISITNNKIEKIEGLDGLDEIEWIDFSGNEISVIENVDNRSRLMFLELSDNNIEEIQGLEGLSTLQSLELDGNDITSIKEFENFPELFQNIYLMKLDLRDNHILDYDEGITLFQSIPFVYLEEQTYEINLEENDQYDEIFKQYNCTVDDCMFNFDNVKINTEDYVDIITNDMLDENNSYFLESVNYPYDLTVTINHLNEVNGVDTINYLTEAKTTQASLLEELGANSLDYDAKDNSDEIYISNYDGYNLNNPQVGVYNLTLTTTNINGYDTNTTVEYKVVYDPLILSQDKNIHISQAPTSTEDLLIKLETQIQDIEGNMMYGEDIMHVNCAVEYMDGYDMTNPQVGTYNIQLSYVDDMGKKVSSESELSIYEDSQIEVPEEVEPEEVEKEEVEPDEVEITDSQSIENTGIDTNLYLISFLLICISFLTYKKVTN